MERKLKIKSRRIILIKNKKAKAVKKDEGEFKSKKMHSKGRRRRIVGGSQDVQEKNLGREG